MVNGKKIAELMRQKGIMNKALAAEVGVSESMMTYITKELREPNVTVLARIAKALGCAVDELIIKEGTA